MKKYLLGVVFAFLLCVQGGASQASVIDYDYFGQLQNHNSLLHFNFSTDAPGSVKFFSSSWDDGGFDPILSLWDSAGRRIAEQDDGHVTGSTMSNGVSYTHGNWDSYFTLDLLAGNYTLIVGTYNNWANGNMLSDGFAFDNQPGIPIADWNQPSNGFLTADIAFHILGVSKVDSPNVPTPEPATMMLTGVGFALMYLRRRGQAQG